jgi:hypothetical protein
LGLYKTMGPNPDPNPGSVVSTDHADSSLSVDAYFSILGGPAVEPRMITADEVRSQNNPNGAFWAVVDNYVVDCTEMIDTHPGGISKLLSADTPAAGATGNSFGFSFSRGRNAHFPDTAEKFKVGVMRYLAGSASPGENHLSPVRVEFPKSGAIVIMGRLAET